MDNTVAEKRRVLLSGDHEQKVETVADAIADTLEGKGCGAVARIECPGGVTARLVVFDDLGAVITYSVMRGWECSRPTVGTAEDAAEEILRCVKRGQG